MSRVFRGERDGPRWTRVPVTIWDQLNGLSPDAKLVYLALLTGRHRTAAPGVFRSGCAALAEAVGFTPRRFLRAVEGLREAGLVLADFEAKVWFLPLAVEDDPAANPNVTVAWQKVISELPDCEVTRLAAARLLEFSKKSRSQVAPLQHGAPNGSGDGSRDGSANQIQLPIPNEDPEQKQLPAFKVPSVEELLASVSNGQQVDRSQAMEFLAYYDTQNWRDVGGHPLASWEPAWTLWRARKRTLKKGTGRPGPWKQIQSGGRGR